MIPQKILRNHDLIGSTACSSQLDKGLSFLTPSTIIGVAVVNDQIAGLEVKLKDGTVYAAHSSFFFIRGFNQLIHDTYVYSQTAVLVQNALSPWLIGSHSFPATEWDGIEKLYMDIAKITKTAIVEVPQRNNIPSPWYSYELSDGIAGQDWRIILPPAPFSPVDPTPVSTCINIHSTFYSGNWDLSINISEEKNVKKIAQAFTDGKGLSHPDPWVRSIKWAVMTAYLLDPNGTKYKKVRQGMKSRLKKVNTAHRIKEYWEPKILNAYKKVIEDRPLCFRKNPKFPYITIMINDWWLKSNTVGMYMQPKGHYDDSSGPSVEKWYHNTDFKCGILGISPLAFDKIVPGTNIPYVKFVILHELIHAILDQRCSKELHGPDFQKMADFLGLPKQFQD